MVGFSPSLYSHFMQSSPSISHNYFNKIQLKTDVNEIDKCDARLS